MIKGEILGKKFCLSERDYEILLRRFDEKNAVYVNANRYEILIPCPLCQRFEDCKGCTFGKFATSKEVGCIIVIRSVLGFEELIYVCVYKIWWGKSQDKKAQKALRKVRDALLSLKEV